MIQDPLALELAQRDLRRGRYGGRGAKGDTITFRKR